MFTTRFPMFLVRGALLVAAMGALSGCLQKEGTLMNKCSCACRQESDTEVSIANKDFYSNAECGSFEGAVCDVTVTTGSGTRQVTGKWEGCQSRGQARVRIRVTPDEIPSVLANPEDVYTPPPQPTR